MTFISDARRSNPLPKCVIQQQHQPQNDVSTQDKSEYLRHWIYYYLDLTPDFHVFFNKVKNAVGFHNDKPHPLLFNWMNKLTNKRELC